MQNEELRKLQKIELELFDEFTRICVKYRLRYYLIGGTLLGALRHQGFIPWDDDIDVGMPREDYDRFANLCGEQLHSNFFYQSVDTDPNYFLTYAKLRKKGTEVYEERFENSKFHKGIFLDIFPLDPCPNPGMIGHLLFNILAVNNYRGQVDSGETYRPYKEVIGKFGYAVLGILSPDNNVKLRKKLLKLSKQFSSGDYLASYSGAYGYSKEVFPTKWYDGDREIIFENRKVCVPNEAEKVTSQLYGNDYLQLPPEMMRKKHVKKFCIQADAD